MLPKQIGHFPPRAHTWSARATGYLYTPSKSNFTKFKFCSDQHTVQELVKKSFIQKFWSRELTCFYLFCDKFETLGRPAISWVPNQILTYVLRNFWAETLGWPNFAKNKSRLWADPGYFLTNSDQVPGTIWYLARSGTWYDLADLVPGTIRSGTWHDQIITYLINEFDSIWHWWQKWVTKVYICRLD